MEPQFGFLCAISLSVLCICIGNYLASRDYKWYEYHSSKYRSKRITAYLRGIPEISVKQEWQPNFKQKTGMYFLDEWGNFFWYAVGIASNILIALFCWPHTSSVASTAFTIAVVSLIICSLDFYYAKRNHRELHDYIVSL